MITELPFDGLKLHLFLFIYRAPYNRTLSIIKRDFYFASGEIDEILKSLVEQNYISIDEKGKKYELTGHGSAFYKAYNEIGLDYIDKEFDNAIISFLYLTKSSFPYEFFPSSILRKAKVIGAGLDAATNLMEWVSYNSPKSNYYSSLTTGCSLDPYGRQYFENLLKEKENKKEKEEIERQDRMISMELKKLNVESLKKIIRNYDDDQKRSRNSFRVSLVAIIISALIFIIQYLIPLIQKVLTKK
jgi:hypothetical protein